MMKVLQAMLRAYRSISETVAATEHPMLLVFYDRAMAQLPSFLKEAHHPVASSG